MVVTSTSYPRWEDGGTEEEDLRAQGGEWWWRVKKVRQVWRDKAAGGLFILNEMKEDRTLMGCETNVQYAVPWRFLSDSEWEHDEQPHILFPVRRRPLSCSSEHKRRSCWCYQFPQRTFSLWALCESTVNDRIPHICLLDVLWDCWCFYLPSGPGCRVRKSAFPSSALQRKTWRYHKSWWWTNASRFLSADNQTFVVWNWIHCLFFHGVVASGLGNGAVCLHIDPCGRSTLRKETVPLLARFCNYNLKLFSQKWFFKCMNTIFIPVEILIHQANFWTKFCISIYNAIWHFTIETLL